jgi:hypothetical protein
MPAESEMSNCIRPHGLVQLQAFSFYVRTKTDINSLATQVDPSTNGANVYSLNFPPGGIGVDLDETQPWIIQLGTKPGQFNTLADGVILDCYLVLEYTLP